MKLTHWMVGLALISGLVIGLNLFFYNFASEYGVTDVNNMSSLNRIAELSESVNETTVRIQQQQGIIETIFTTAGLLWGVFVQLISLPLLFISTITDVDVLLSPYGGLPGWFVLMVGTIITIFIIYGIASILANRERL